MQGSGSAKAVWQQRGTVDAATAAHAKTQVIDCCPALNLPRWSRALLEQFQRVDHRLDYAPGQRDSDEAPGQRQLDAVTGCRRLIGVRHHPSPKTGAASTSASMSSAFM